MIRLRFSSRFLPLALAALLPVSALAASIGKAHVLSRLGEPLRVEIELSGLTASQAVPNCYGVEARQPSAASIAGLREAPLELVARGSGTRLLFRTVTPVSEPLIRLQLRAGCGIELLRSFDLMLPLASDAPDTVVLPNEALVAPALPVTTDEARVAAARPAARPKPDETAAAPATASAAPRAPTPPRAPAASVADPAQQAVLTAAAQLTAAKSESERAAIVARLQQSLAQAGKPPAEIPAVAPTAPSASVAPPSAAPAAPGVTEQSGMAAAASSPVASPAASAPRQIPKVAAPQPVVVADDGVPIWWIFAAGLLATAGYWAWHRRRAAGEAATDSAVTLRTVRAASEKPATAPAAVVASDAANIFREPAAVGGGNDLDASEAASMSPLQDRLAMRSTHPDFDPDMPMPQVEQFDEEAEVIELAELMLQFGRVSGAVDTLRGYLDEAPKAALLPWLRLLEIYRQANQRTEFEDAARHLNRHFNVQVVTWEQANANAEVDAVAPQTLEGYPRAMQGIVDSWGSAAGLDFLNDLLHDNRDGARVGFPPEVAKEILFLISVLKETLAGDASPARLHGGVAA